jgi:hypothetical protein
MRFSPLPALAVVTIIQVVLAGCLAYVSLKASVAHQHTADLYAEQLRLRESSPHGDTVPVSFLRLATKEAAAADRSFGVSLVLSLGIIALAVFQLWFALDAWAAVRTSKGLMPNHTPE